MTREPTLDDENWAEYWGATAHKLLQEICQIPGVEARLSLNINFHRLNLAQHGDQLERLEAILREDT